MAPSPSDKNDLGARIAAAQAKEAEKYRPKKSGTSSASGYGLGMKMVLDLVGGALVGLIFGSAIDQIFKTKPWGLLVLLCLGLISGFSLMLRSAQSHANRNAENGFATAKGQAGANEGQESE